MKNLLLFVLLFFTNNAFGKNHPPLISSFGVGSAYSQKYLGSKDSEYKTIPLLNMNYYFSDLNSIYLSTTKGIGYAFDFANPIKIGLGLSYREGKDKPKSGPLNYLHEVNDTLTINAFFDYNMSKNYKFSINFDKGLDDSNEGLTTKVKLAYKDLINPKLLFKTSVSTLFGDSSFNRQHFATITHNTHAAFVYFDLDTNLDYNFYGNNFISTGLKYRVFTGDAVDSPITQDDQHLGFNIGYLYRF